MAASSDNKFGLIKGFIFYLKGKNPQWIKKVTNLRGVNLSSKFSKSWISFYWWCLLW